jgi:hypothetical protein
VSEASTKRPTKGLWPSLVIGVFVIAYLVSGYMTLGDTTRFVPMMAGGVTLLLLAVDLYCTAFGRSRAMETDTADIVGASPGREWQAIAYVAGAVAMIGLFGFLVAIPIYLFISVAFLGKQSVRAALIVSLLTSLVVYVLFEILLGYTLYPGMYFE